MEHSQDPDSYSDLLLTSHVLDVISRQIWDTIVIGSGMGGLTASSALAKGGLEKVLLLEAHTKLGGCTHEFSEKGLQFDTGLHYVGGQVWKEDSTARRTFDWITDREIQWERLDDVYDVATVKNEVFPMRSGISKQKADLIKRFPQYVNEINAYWKEVDEQVVNFSSWMKRTIESAYLPEVFIRKDPSFGQETVNQALDRLNIKDETLREVLTYLHGDYGATPEEASWVQHCMVVSHYSPGAAYPIGGPGKIARSVLRIIEQFAGRAVTRARVESIVIENGKAVGVMLKGRIVRAKKVISCIGAYHTFTKLISSEHDKQFPFLPKIRQELQSNLLKSSPTHAMTFLALNGSAKELNIPKANWWIQDDPNFPSIFISFPSAKDPTWEERHPGKSVCEIVVEAEYEFFESFGKEPTKGHSEEYTKMKTALSEKMKTSLFKHFPQLKDKIEFEDASTPLSAEHFLNSKKGCAYGLACIPARYQAKWLKPLTDIPNLYLGAQDVVSCGIVGSMMGGLICAASASFRTLLEVMGFMYSSRPITDTKDQWIQEEVDSGGVLF